MICFSQRLNEVKIYEMKKKKFYVGHKGSSERLQTIFYENPRHENKLVSEKYRKT